MKNNINYFGVFTISGFNIRAVIAISRYCFLRNIPLHLATINKKDKIYLTKYIENVFIERTSPSLDVTEFLQWISNLRKKYGYKKVLIAPSSEFFNRFLLANRDVIEVAGGVIPLVNKSLYERISDKHSFADLCINHGILVPAEFAKPPSEFPFVAKPLNYSSINDRQLKPYLLYNEKNWLEFSKAEEVSDFYYQEYIYGHSIYLLMYISRNGTVTKYSQENLIQQACGGSIILAKGHDFHESDEAEKYIAMLRDVKYFGLIMIEVRFCQKTNRYIMIEANPRVWGPMQFLIDNNIDLFGELFRDFFNINIESDNSVENVYDYYFWSGGMSSINSPFAFHNFSQNDFINNFKNIVFCDVFCRDDTIKLYKQELKS